MIRSIAGSIVRPLAVAITGAGAVPDLAADVRALFSANGGDFTGTMLDFTDSTALWQDTGATTPAGDGDTLARVDDQSGEGNNATQSSAASRPAVTTDAFGTPVAAPDGTDDYMNLPDGVLGDGTDAISVSIAVGPNATDSDADARLIQGASGAGFVARVSSSLITLQVAESGTANTETIDYGRALTDNETVVVTFQWAPSSAPKIRINGAVVAEGTSSYTALDDPGAPDIFGNGTSNNLAAIAHGCVALTGTSLPTSAQLDSVEAYLADLANDTLLTADADTVLRRVFNPVTDLDVEETWAAYADQAAAEAAGWSVTSATFDAANDQWDFSSLGSVEKTFPLRVGYTYRITVDLKARTAGAGFIRLNGSNLLQFNDTQEHSYEFTATQQDNLIGFGCSAAFEGSFGSISITEIPATGTYYDLLDATKRFTDAGSTQAGANDDVQQIDDTEGLYPLTQVTAANQATLDGTATNLVFDGTNDYYVATDASDDLVMTGDTTELWAVTPATSASDRVISSAGDSTVATDTASVFSINGSDQLSLQQADASNTETEATAITVTEGSVNVVSFVRDGASVVFGIGADEVETETFATVTSPTAGSSLAFSVGISVDQSSGAYDGSVQAGLKVDRALATGLTVHAIRALTEKTA